MLCLPTLLVKSEEGCNFTRKCKINKISLSPIHIHPTLRSSCCRHSFHLAWESKAGLVPMQMNEQNRSCQTWRRYEVTTPDARDPIWLARQRGRAGKSIEMDTTDEKFKNSFLDSIMIRMLLQNLQMKSRSSQSSDLTWSMRTETKTPTARDEGKKAKNLEGLECRAMTEAIPRSNQLFQSLTWEEAKNWLRNLKPIFALAASMPASSYETPCIVRTQMDLWVDRGYKLNFS